MSARVHEAWIGRTEQVFVERISSRSSKAAGNVELGWEAARVQMSGRTGGNLITVFDLPEGMSPDEVIGHILPVRITGAGPLILRGALLVQAEGDGRESNATLAPA